MWKGRAPEPECKQRRVDSTRDVNALLVVRSVTNNYSSVRNVTYNYISVRNVANNYSSVHNVTNNYLPVQVIADECGGERQGISAKQG